jgi:hypothetical protein
MTKKSRNKVVLIMLNTSIKKILLLSTSDERMPYTVCGVQLVNTDGSSLDKNKYKEYVSLEEVSDKFYDEILKDAGLNITRSDGFLAVNDQLVEVKDKATLSNQNFIFSDVNSTQFNANPQDFEKKFLVIDTNTFDKRILNRLIKETLKEKHYKIKKQSKVNQLKDDITLFNMSEKELKNERVSLREEIEKRQQINQENRKIIKELQTRLTVVEASLKNIEELQQQKNITQKVMELLGCKNLDETIKALQENNFRIEKDR